MPSSSLVAAIIVGSLASASAGFTCESVDAVCRDCGDGCNLISKLTDITDEDECCAACVDEPQCISWTLNHYSQECHLKDAVAEASDGNCTSGGSAGVNRPHILLITSDQQRTDTVSAYHNDRGVSGGGLTSPNFDRLAAQGVRWTEALVTSPVCSPCRTSLLTGVHVPVHKVVENSVAPYPDDLSVYPDVLESQGYTSYMIGKTHFSPVPSSFALVDAHTGNTDMRCDSDTYAAHNGTCEYYDEADFLETYLVNTTMDQLDTHLNTTSAPFFVHLSFLSPHPPDTPPLPWDTYYDEDDLPPINYEAGDVFKLPYQTRMLLGLLGDDPQSYMLDDYSLNTTQVDAARVLYHGLAAYVDSQLGRMVDWIDDRELASSTLLIFTSDHGAMLYDHGVGNDKHSFHESSWKVPMFMRQPGVLPANTTAGFATTIDVTASILAASGVDWSQQEQSYSIADGTDVSFFMSGLDLYTPLKNGEDEPRFAVAATEFRGYAVATQYWKLVYMSEQNEGRLFDRENDVLERTDLWDEPAYAEVKNAMVMGLFRWRAQQDDLQYQLSNWNSARRLDVGENARNDSEYMSGRVAEYNLNDLAADVDAMWPTASAKTKIMG